MQSQLLNLLLGPNNPMSSNLMSLAKSAELAETAAQGFEAFQTGKLPEFIERQYDTNIIFWKFYDAGASARGHPQQCRDFHGLQAQK